MLSEDQWAQVFTAAKKRGARWVDLADVNAFKRAILEAIDAPIRPVVDRPLNTTPFVDHETPIHVTQEPVYPKPISLIDANLLAVVAKGREASDLEVWACAIRKACAKFEINTVRRVAAFIAQMAHESGLKPISENLSYSAPRLCQVWPRRFPSIAHATPYARNPEKLANKVYGGRMGNGNEASGDGWRFRGGGPLQLTGRDNWTAFAKAMGMSLDDALHYGRTIEGGVMTAAWFWEANDINRLADTPGVADESKRINGGANGLEDRKLKFDALVAALLKAGG